MRCRSCREAAGFWRRLCRECAQVLAIYERVQGTVGLSQLLDLLIETGIPRAKIEAALESDVDGRGVLKDRITADMANRLLADMGVASQQTAGDVRRVREGGGVGASTRRPAGDVGPPRRRR